MIDVDKKVNHGEFFKQIKEVYSYLEDDISRNLFNAIMIYNTNADTAETLNLIINNASPIIKSSIESGVFKPNIELRMSYNYDVSLPLDKTLIIYGANENGQYCYEQFSKCRDNILFCDIRNEEIKEFCGVPVISLEDLINDYKDCYVFISDRTNHKILLDFVKKFNINVIRSYELVIIFITGCFLESLIGAVLSFNNNIIFCDIDNNLKEFKGFPVITTDELVQNYSDNKIIFSDEFFTHEKYEFIKAQNFKDIYLRIVFDCEGQYFDECIKLSENEIFLDCGVLDASTSLLFAKNTNYKYKKIIMCEPNNDVHSDILENTKHLKNIELKKVGVWNEKDTLKFDSCDINLGGSRITDDGEISIEVDSIDNILNGKEVTFIKMDIEGAELNALKGASETIKKYKPKLAISLYHKPEDITEIPAFIKSLVPEYKMYIRHYSNVFAETVLYAVL